MRQHPLRSGVLLTTALVAVLGLVHRLDPIGEGLIGTYYATPDWSGPAAFSTLDPRPSTARLVDVWHGEPLEMFSTIWAGSLLVPRGGAYTLATVSDDGSRVFVDGKLIVDNGGRHGPVEARGSVALTRGVHGIFIQYAEEGGGATFEFSWGRDGAPLTSVPSWALTPRRAGFWPFVMSAALRRVLAAAEWVWVSLLLLALASVVWRRAAATRSWLERDGVWPAMAGIAAASLVLNVIGIWWGVPGGAWAPDESTPFVVLGGLSARFAHGWWAGYPVFQYVALAASFSPILLLEYLGRIDLFDPAWYAAITIAGRLLTVAAALGTLLAVYACGARTFGRRAGVAAAAMLALVAPFVYYAKTSNPDVQYVFLFSVSLLFYLRALDTLRTADIVGFAAFGMLAIVTKDQAYALYLLTPFAIMYRIREANRAAGMSAPLVRAIVDRRLLLAAVVACVVFVCGHNLLFNWAGFVEHVRFLTGGGSQNYRVFEPTIAGRAALAALTIDLVRVAWGWPLFLVSVAGLGLAIATRQLRRTTIWLLLPAVSYYVGFVNVILYSYDRYVLPICLVLSLFGGLAIDRWLRSSGRVRTWKAAGVAAIFAYSVLYAGMVDAVMIRDSRYRVEAWLAGRVGLADRVAFVFPRQYYPRLEPFRSLEIQSVEELEEQQPAYFVLNAEYARSEPGSTPIGRLIAGLQGGSLGYERVFQYRAPVPWRWLPGAHRDLIGPRMEKPITSSLRHINPTFEVFQRRP